VSSRAALLRGSGARLALALNAGIAISYVVLWLTLARDAWQTDFIAFYAIATMVLDGDGQLIYDAAALTRAEQRVLAGLVEVSRPHLFVNPPAVALLVAPVALLPHRLAYWTWTGLQVGLLGWSLVLAHRAAARWTVTERRLLLVTIAALPPVLISFVLGTLSIVLLLCLWQVTLALAAGRPVRAGLWLSVGLIKLQHWPLLFMMLLASRQWRVLGTLALVSAAAVAVTTLVLGWPIWRDWLVVVAPILDQRGDITVMPTFRGSLVKLAGDGAMLLVSRLNWLALLGAALAVAWLWWKRRPSAEPTFAARFGLTIILGLFLSPHLYPHDSLLIVVPATLGYAVARGFPGVQPIYGGLAVASPALLILSDRFLDPAFAVTVPVLLILALTGWLTWASVHGCVGAGLPTATDQG
jgi:hypothetical protein